MPSRVRQYLVRLATGLLTKPLGHYQRRVPNDLASLRRHIKKGDVILVEGDQRVSEVIKYLSQSAWSHAAIYIGDELWRRNPALSRVLTARYGTDGQHLLVEALVEEGVVAAPLSKYIDFNIRVCRPYNLRREDLQTVLDDVIAQIGYRYNVKNLIDLARYFLPVSLVPRRLRRTALEFGSGVPTQAICSSMIAHAFGKVRYPILPQVIRNGDAPPAGCSTGSPAVPCSRTRSSARARSRSRRRAISTSPPTSRWSNSTSSRRCSSTTGRSAGRRSRRRASRGGGRRVATTVRAGWRPSPAGAPPPLRKKAERGPSPERRAPLAKTRGRRETAFSPATT
jgi:hypothetical protein